MALMFRALVLTMVFVVVPRAAAVQALSILHIRVVLVDAEGRSTPVPRHALLVSDNPPTAPPRRVVTATDGTAFLNLRPGTYIVESDRPVTVQGQVYQWMQIVDIAAGQDTVLELTANAAEAGSATSATTTASATTLAAPLETDASALVLEWQESVVAVWTPTARASGFVVDAQGLIATHERAIGTATSVEVQLTPTVKVAGRVLVADPVRGVAVLWIDPAVLTSGRPVPLGCTDPVPPPFVYGQEIFTIGASLRERNGLASGLVNRVERYGAVSDFMLTPDSAGGPVFAEDGTVLGLTSVVDNVDASRPGDFWIVRVDDACDAVASAEVAMTDAVPPDGTPLPVEPVQTIPIDALAEAAKGRAGSLRSTQMSSSDFDIAFITPVLAYAAEESMRAGAGDGISRAPDSPQAFVRPLLDFGNWSDYVRDLPPVLLVRVTPRLVESFWTKVVRGAAWTQGISLPAFEHFESSFSRMRAFCGDAEITPVHPFILEWQASEDEMISEGLYAFEPDALGPACGTVELVLYSEKDPGKGDTRVVEPAILRQIWQDFAPYRALE